MIIYRPTADFEIPYESTMAQVQLNEVFIYCDTTLNPITIKLPKISNMKGNFTTKFFVLDNKGTAGKNAITIISDTSNAIVGANVVSSEYDCLVFQATDDTHWLSSGGINKNEYLFQQIPYDTGYPSYIQPKDILGEVNDLGLIYNPPYVKLKTNGNIAQLSRVLTILSGKYYIFQAWDYQTIDPNPFYWVVMEEETSSRNLIHLTDLKWTDQFFNQGYQYIVNKSTEPTNSCKLVNYTAPTSGGSNVESYITTLTYNRQTNTLSATDQLLTFGGNTFLSLYNEVTGLSLIAIDMDYAEPLFSANSDFSEILNSDGAFSGYVYFWDLNETNVYTNIVGYNVITGQTRLVKPYDSLSLTTNFTPIDIYQSITLVLSHPKGIYFVLDDQQTTDNGPSLQGVTSIWSPDNTQYKTFVKYLNTRNEFGQYASTNGGINNNTTGGMLSLSAPIDSEYIYLYDSPVITGVACNLVVSRFPFAYTNNNDYELSNIPFSNLTDAVQAVASFPTDKGMLMASFTPVAILPQYSANFHWTYWRSVQGFVPAQLQLNEYAPTNYYQNTIYGTTNNYSAVNWVSYGITYDKFNQNF